eukprot:TRINITY_DN780_c0_g1_i4.p1 TRINITY_DN780_c0_g1~~TRINITY_DN780_c0_g1_i4.p1  ORF type:complete len:1070 (-),score=251.18 TRINITY_DN780_c0_g1_i4:200-3409(-)
MMAVVTKSEEYEPLVGAPKSVQDDLESGPGHPELDPWEPYYEDFGERTDKILETDDDRGLSSEEAGRRLALFGKNEFPREEKNQLLELLKTFTEPMAIIVWMAILIEAVEAAGNWPGNESRTNLIDCFVLLLLQFLNSFVGWYENMMAEEKVRQVASSIASTVNVTRDGQTTDLPVSELVPGDIVSLAHGKQIPADCKLVDDGGLGIKVDESMLTGESEAVSKCVVADSGVSGCDDDRLISQTVLSSGEAKVVVLRTGTKSNYYRLFALSNAPNDISHFETVLQQLLIALVAVGLVVVLVVFIFLLAGPPGEDLGDTLSFCVVLLVASIPIAMKVVCTVTLAMGASELANEQAIVQRLSSIEELAGLKILCSDKTGTLTLNKMELKDDLDPTDATEKQILDSLEFDHPGREGFHRIFTDNLDERGDQFDRMALLKMGVLAARWPRWHPEDAIDTMLLTSGAMLKTDLKDQYRLLHHSPFDHESRMTFSYNEFVSNKKRFAVAKGACAKVVGLCEASTRLKYNGHHITSEELKKIVDQAEQQFAVRGIRCMVIARSDDEIPDLEEGEGPNPDWADQNNYTNWYVVGLLTFLDPARPDSRSVIHKASLYGVTVKMITGDSQPIAKEMCKTVGLGQNVLTGADLKLYPPEKLQSKELVNQKFFAKHHGSMCYENDGFAQVKPEHKYLIVESLREMGYLVGMCGDGVNDAPALKRADVGIAVQGATDAAMASSDIVLTEAGLGTIITALIVARKIFTRMQNFVIYRVACTEQLLFFFLISCLCFKPSGYLPADYEANGGDRDDWPDYFSLPVLALVTITILNDGTIISVAYDNVDASREPQSWNLPILYWISSVIGFIALISSIILLEVGLQSAKGGDNGMCAFGPGAMEYGEIQTMMYLKISLSDYGSVFNSRTKSWCWTKAPSAIVLGAAVVAVALATIFSRFWFFGAGMKSIGWDIVGLVWIYVLVWMVIQDAAKVANYKLLFYLGLVEDVGIISNNELEDQKNYGNPISVDDDNAQGLAAGFVDHEVGSDKGRSCFTCESGGSNASRRASQKHSSDRDEDPAHLYSSEV